MKSFGDNDNALGECLTGLGERDGGEEKAPGLLHTTRALCPDCLAVLPAEVGVDKDGQVWMSRSCPEHGDVQTRLWPSAEHYEWLRSLAFPKVAPSREALRPSGAPCPTGCGICGRHQRRPTLVEIEVTQRCNLRCPVCFMSAEAEFTDVPLERLRGFYETIARTAGTETGVQLTGGEPTVRADLPAIVRMGREMGFWGVEVNTNGVVIARDPAYLRQLVEAGCTGIYLQFDGVSAEPYRLIRGADLLAVKLKAVENCRAAGIQVVLAMTIVAGLNDHEVGATLRYALENVDVVAGLALQPAFTSGRFEAGCCADAGAVEAATEATCAVCAAAGDATPTTPTTPTNQEPRRAEPLTMGDVIFLLEEQTAGLVRRADIWPLGCSHPLCDTGTFLVDGLPITRDLTSEDYHALYNPASPQGSVFGDILARKGLSAAAARGLSLIIMNYMDAWTCDLERMEECSMFVTMPDGRLIPFCSYQLTNCAGKRLYPPWGVAPDALDQNGALRWI